MKRILLHFLITFTLFINAGHVGQGTNYSASGVHAYALSRHGIDGSIFLDPFFMPFLENVQNRKVLDAGCGAGPWSIYAAKKGAHVYGIDIQDGMIAVAKKNAQEEQISKSVEFTVGSVKKLPYLDNFFDKAISINVGCNLPQDVFIAHFKELYRTLSANGHIIITAPASFDTVFGTTENIDVEQEIERVLATLKDLQEQSIKECLSILTSVLRATFAIRNGKLILITDEKQLVEGEPIWRKIPGLVVPNYYHSEKSYIRELAAAGFNIERIDRPRFDSADTWKQNNAYLCKEYYYFHPFVIITAAK